ncbi:MAG: MarR family winged helix-turn-helix transcriptional regulator [Erysipelotrichaceae bacterium]|uniref:MarR family winged helix-turn-helix transcriptional regulator n=1 Tax=Floccifex sp. TaxID=2815810 RepID=UPI002A75C011|nr:MarR family winged helix-turn-helix transcriptional regulator [Floccifex sp.]MDD7281116.1 MarR family winged helix-turn-helix transcriptional regulator [Erysipelotrichaceae bacterium]MDY2957781.1 MarR family winged helix-turn-helix transcriptional regulator [Floccifex sp.]
MELSEKLIETWNTISYILKPERLFRDLSYNEQTICSLLYRAQKEMTATDLIEQTSLLKSQMNKIMNSLEQKDVIQRIRSEEDKRKIVVELTDYGKEIYRKEHQSVLEISNHIIEQLGTKKSEQLISLMEEALDIIEKGDKK